MRMNYINNPITKTFYDAFPRFKRADNDTSTTLYFWESWQASPFYDSNISEADMLKCYNHLLATYYNSNFKYKDDFGITLNVFHTIEEYYPDTILKLSVASQLNALTVSDYEKAGHQLQSSAQNPTTSNALDAQLPYVDAQTGTFNIKSTDQALATKYGSIISGIMDAFCELFRYQFVVLYNGYEETFYENDVDSSDE